MKDYNVEKVPVTVHLTPEAARALYAYAGERNRGRFLSDLIMEQRRRDEMEGEAIAAEIASKKLVEAPTKPVGASQPVSGGNGRKNRHKRR